MIYPRLPDNLSETLYVSESPVQSSPGQYCIYTVPCRAVPCRAVPCHAVVHGGTGNPPHTHPHTHPHIHTHPNTCVCFFESSCKLTLSRAYPPTYEYFLLSSMKYLGNLEFIPKHLPGTPRMCISICLHLFMKV